MKKTVITKLSNPVQTRANGVRNFSVFVNQILMDYTSKTCWVLHNWRLGYPFVGEGGGGYCMFIKRNCEPLKMQMNRACKYQHAPLQYTVFPPIAPSSCCQSPLFSASTQSFCLLGFCAFPWRGVKSYSSDETGSIKCEKSHLRIGQLQRGSDVCCWPACKPCRSLRGLAATQPSVRKPVGSRGTALVGRRRPR